MTPLEVNLEVRVRGLRWLRPLLWMARRVRVESRLAGGNWSTLKRGDELLRDGIEGV